MDDVVKSKMTIGSLAKLFIASIKLFSFLYSKRLYPYCFRAAITCSSVRPFILKGELDIYKAGVGVSFAFPQGT